MIVPRFRDILREAIRHFATAGFTTEGELRDWQLRLHYALDRELPGDKGARAIIEPLLLSLYHRDVNKLAVKKLVPGVTRFGVDRISPHLRAELDRRIFAGVDLIRINRRKRIEETLQRFSGWVSSIPPGGRAEPNIRETYEHIAKPSKQLKYEARRVAIDQGHKLSAAVAHVTAMDGGAIAAIWHDRGEYDAGYDARPVHLHRSGKLFFIRDSWAMERGFIKRGARPYTDEFEQPAELPYCSCYYEYLTALSALPSDLIAARGKLWLAGEGVRKDSVDPDPSEGQQRAGNYQKEHVRFQGLVIMIETKRGMTRRGVGPDGPWEVVMPADYGYIRGADGRDGDNLDVFVGPYDYSEKVWVIEQRHLDTASFDEHKIMVGFNFKSEALACYDASFSDGRGLERILQIREMHMDWLKLMAKGGIFAA